MSIKPINSHFIPDGTGQSSFQIDKYNNGPKLKNSSGILEIRNHSDSAYATLKANIELLDLLFSGIFSDVPSSVYNVVAENGITGVMISSRTIRVQSSTNGNCIISANPRISDGYYDGQEIILEGRDNVKTVTLNSGNGIKLNDGIPFTLGKGDIISLKYNSLDDIWYELYRSKNS